MKCPSLWRRPPAPVAIGVAAAVAISAMMAGCAGNNQTAPKAEPAKTNAPAASPAPAPAGKPAVSTAKPAANPGGPVADESNVDHDALAQRIRDMVKDRGVVESQSDQANDRIRPEVSARQQVAAKPAAGGEALSATRTPGVPSASPTPAPGAQTGEPPKKDAAGCHGATGQPELTPPPAGEPQPKFVCKQSAITRDDIWKGQPAVFKFAVANEGEGALQIRLKGG